MNDRFGVPGRRCLLLDDPGIDDLLSLTGSSDRGVKGVVEIHGLIDLASLVGHATSIPSTPSGECITSRARGCIGIASAPPGGRLLDCWATSEEGGFIDAQEALRETSDDLLSDLDALSELEDEKRRTQHGDPRLVELAARVEEIAARVLAGSRRQLTLSHSVSDSANDGSADPTATISGTPRNLADILADWRAAERDARTAQPGSVEAEEARVRAERLRQEYRNGFDDARKPDGV